MPLNQPFHCCVVGTGEHIQLPVLIANLDRKSSAKTGFVGVNRKDSNMCLMALELAQCFFSS